MCRSSPMASPTPRQQARPAATPGSGRSRTTATSSSGYTGSAGGVYADLDFTGTHANGTRVGMLGATDGSDPSIYVDARSGGGYIGRVNNVQKFTYGFANAPAAGSACSNAGQWALTDDGHISECQPGSMTWSTSTPFTATSSSGYTGSAGGVYADLDFTGTHANGTRVGMLGATDGSDPSIYVDARSGGGYIGRVNNVQKFTYGFANAPAAGSACSNAGQWALTDDGHISECQPGSMTWSTSTPFTATSSSGYTGSAGGVYADLDFTGTHANGTRVGMLGATDGSDPSIYVDARSGGGYIGRVNNVQKFTYGFANAPAAGSACSNAGQWALTDDRHILQRLHGQRRWGVCGSRLHRHPRERNPCRHAGCDGRLGPFNLCRCTLWWRLHRAREQCAEVHLWLRPRPGSRLGLQQRRAVGAHGRRPHQRVPARLHDLVDVHALHRDILQRLHGQRRWGVCGSRLHRHPRERNPCRHAGCDGRLGPFNLCRCTLWWRLHRAREQCAEVHLWLRPRPGSRLGLQQRRAVGAHGRRPHPPAATRAAPVGCMRISTSPAPTRTEPVSACRVRRTARTLQSMSMHALV